MRASIAGLILLAITACSTDAQETYDLVILNGRVMDPETQFDAVRNVGINDGLIVTADMTTGFWAFKMEGFDGWNGHQWGMPNVSSVQDWDNGPDGAPKPPQRAASR